MTPATVFRQLFLPVVLAAASLALWQVAERMDYAVVTVEDIDFESEPQTPAFAARRIPSTLIAPIREVAINSDIESVIDLAPEDTCLAVTVPGGPVEPALSVQGGVVPASNMKVLTTYAALEILGPEFTYRTVVAADAQPSGGIVNGNLYMVGAGDPFLATQDWISQYDPSPARSFTRLEDLADGIVAAGVTTVTGSIVGDESLLDTERFGDWPSVDITNNQTGPMSALTVNEGFVDWPETYQGSVRPREQATDPAVHAAQVLETLLVQRGVTTNGTSSGPTPASAVEIAHVESPPMSAAATHINSFSSNIGAELVLKRIGLEQFNEGSTAAGAEAVRTLLTEGGVQLTDVVIADGSGLSQNNRLTCQSVTELLTLAGGESALADSMAIGGVRGTLTEKFTSPLLTGRVEAKTGTLNNTRALAGYVTSLVDGSSSQFTVITNQERIVDDDVTELHEALAETLVRRPSGPAMDRLSPLEPIPTEDE